MKKNYAKVYSAQVDGLEGHLITIEVDVSNGLYNFSVVGLGDKAVDESRDRVSAAIKNSGFKPPKQRNQKVVVSLAPADLPKGGARFDLAIAIGYLQAVGELEFNSEDKAFIGELALDGSLREIKGALRLAQSAKQSGIRELYVPPGNAEEASLVANINIYPVKTLSELVKHLGNKPESPKSNLIQPHTASSTQEEPKNSIAIDMAHVRGQQTAKRALEIAAAGCHNLAMFGPPGTGKTMLAKAFAGILPPLEPDEVLEVTAIHSVAGQTGGKIVTQPPLREPHHTASHVAIVGGGSNPRPGEITLAHRGVMFMDEFPEFDRKVLETLRQPLENGEVSVSRARGTYRFPARFILVAAMNPCPCGFLGSHKPCICTPIQIERYKKKLSGPIIDRIDLWTEVAHIDIAKLGEADPNAETSTVIKDRVQKARTKQLERYKEKSIFYNRDLPSSVIEKVIRLNDSAKEIAQQSARKLELSPRSYFRVLRVARTIADLEDSDTVEDIHVLEALQYRPKQIL